MPLKNTFFSLFEHFMRWKISKLIGNPPKGWIINERHQMKRLDSNSSCYTRTQGRATIDIYLCSFLYQKHTEGFAWPCPHMLLCLSHISSAAECQCFLWPSSKDLSICPILLHFALWIIFGDLFFHIFFCCTAVESHWIICSEEIIRPFTSIADCTINATFSVLCPHKMRSNREAKLITGEIQWCHILCIHRRSSRSLSHQITSPRSLKICWLTTSHAPHVFTLGLSALSLDRGLLPPSPPPPPPPPQRPPPPSFWRVGSSELVAVCTAKGNVSSTRRKMGQNIRTLTAHAQWHTALGLCAPSESDHCVLSYPLPCTWMFPLLTPVLSHLLLMPHNGSRLHSLLLPSSRSGPGHGDA